MCPEVDQGHGNDRADVNFHENDIPFEQSVHLHDGTYTILNVVGVQGWRDKEWEFYQGLVVQKPYPTQAAKTAFMQRVFMEAARACGTGYRACCKEMPADGLTKPLVQDLHVKFVKILGLESRKVP
ncbi:hypothetical protein B0T26DRAFT_678239 [Lasiosphaeria miniovina]|uniref:Uncharacterized protein n=1 Tax=Lasiosphaeria miniovina TaxID=1954250 RepID=A0AA40ADL2_9PEZI|nr:uncharacterized protein B0T26DRAFT_678239 [Lasiosphaeria miniovina]KAK0713967.1 hypothetical protein B0T26DRAFT_678239 [Lasiosphaeria miniovina]